MLHGSFLLYKCKLGPREETESRGQMEKMDEGSWNMC